MRVSRDWALAHPAAFVSGVAGASVLASVTLTTVAVALTGEADAGMWWVSLLIAVAVPLTVSIPISRLVLELVRDAETARREARRLADVDPLTGATTRRRFIELAEQTMASRSIDPAVNVPAPRSVVLIDIDDFKRVNDTYGHLAGDRVLAEVAAYGSSLLGPDDVLGRWGGEEFVLLLLGDVRRALAVAEALRARVAEHQSHDPGHPCAISISAGVATIDDRGLDAAIAAADAAMYQAKRTGKNRVAGANPVPGARIGSVGGAV